MIFDVIKICAFSLSYLFCALVFYRAGRGKTGCDKKEEAREKEGWESILNYNHRKGGDTR